MSRASPLRLSRPGHRRLEQAPPAVISSSAYSLPGPASRRNLICDARHYGYPLARSHHALGLGVPELTSLSWWIGGESDDHDRENQLPL
ncbi:hypothetical protein [Thermogemmatispora tikiterensis]|uniref:Uncharacterized protein n=1 Tax=Thermogemmatispora tikiterensis TaxID=1825093 RepID=A0A328VD73_9CHLR|nr:hypothetical protein [Thermogemmatispora tikiterensis]RAQ95636.1 hypothetical protein A4R35_08835 [Thermogemmatispora tikiterensis]